MGMGYPNLKKYVEFEKAFRKVGEHNLRNYVLSKGHDIRKFDRNMKIIRYTLQHGPSAASQIFHVSPSTPSHVLYRYGNYAIDLAEIIEREKQ